MSNFCFYSNEPSGLLTGHSIEHLDSYLLLGSITLSVKLYEWVARST